MTGPNFVSTVAIITIVLASLITTVSPESAFPSAASTLADARASSSASSTLNAHARGTSLNNARAQPLTSGCPLACACKWKSGKETTECVEKDLRAVPAGVAAGTQVLDLRGNPLGLLADNVFLERGITNLQRIFCSNCQLAEVEPLAFRRLTNLVELDLSENVLREVPSDALRLAKALMRLNLSGNPLRIVRARAFDKLKFVTNLYLDHCAIEAVEGEAFAGMDSLLELRLENNRLNYLMGVNLFPRSLHLIEVSFIIFL